MTRTPIMRSRGWVDRAATAIMVVFGALLGAVAVSAAVGPQGLGNPGPPAWGVFAFALLAAAYGQRRGARWASVLTFVLGIVIIVISGFLALFSFALSGGDLSGPWLGLPIVGILNGWLSLVVFGVVIGGGVLMVASALRPAREPIPAERI